jgi:L-threonylcarbamoyladenylate synthase
VGENKSVNTLRLVVDPAHLDTAEAQETLERGARILRAGGLVALPTETVYGLGANALDAGAVERIFAAKQRPAWDPVIVHIASLVMLEGLVEEVPPAARKLMEAFLPAHPVALELIRRAGVPVAAPSANLFGRISPTTAAHVLEDLDGRIDAVVDAGATAHGVESTVLDPDHNPMVIYRPGAVTAEQIRAVAGAVEVFRGGNLADNPREALPSPGLGLRHYAPRARLVLVEGELADLRARLGEAVMRWPGERMGVMLPAEVGGLSLGAVEYAWGRWVAPVEMARELYAGLRALDAAGCTMIVCPVPQAEGIGAAIRDRLGKAGNRE